ncbi:DUF488 domain-containing protein [Dyadobacter frigoris]|uniref:DUF488 domain-containing protein n=1 Tax=Dyadobacter frigoris TaxID=2576211 RepID=A0A4U6CQI7_9BACT|nr:DUF488 domain-containing protein [Dyadobacter frigoris]TKT85098.1 DUF488 domain-containing protein [Dyadobacter frigoris]GLU57303.1 hypothetical protein Dfri01_67640 [Dyadobacter frigoris]
MIQLYTIGFTKKSAETFFTMLKDSGVTRLVDTRINNVSQLSGFAKGTDLKYFSGELVNIFYEHNIDFAPAKELLSLYRTKKLTWPEYEIEYLNLLDTRKIAQKINIEKLHKNCLLCSEHKPEKCHRRLLAEYLQQVRNDIQITHLI